MTDKQYYLGCDLARLGQDSSVFIIIQKGTPNKVIYIKEIPTHRMDEAFSHIRYLDKKFDFQKIMMDESGLGAGVTDMLARTLNPSKKPGNIGTFTQTYREFDKVVGITFTIKNKMDIYSNLKLLMEQGKLIIPDNRKLIYQLKDLRYETTLQGNLKLHHSEGGQDDYADSLALACAGLRERGFDYLMVSAQPEEDTLFEVEEY